MAHEVNISYNEKLDHMNTTLTHLIQPWNISYSLALVIRHHKFYCTLKKSGPIEARLKNHGKYIVGTKASTICRNTITVKGTLNLIFRKTSPINMILAHLVEKRLFLHTVLKIGKKISYFVCMINAMATLHILSNSRNQHTKECLGEK